MQSFIDRSLPKFNSKRSYIEFASVTEMEAFQRENNIGARQEFWFSIDNAPCVFDCVFQYFYEG